MALFGSGPMGRRKFKVANAFAPEMALAGDGPLPIPETGQALVPTAKEEAQTRLLERQHPDAPRYANDGLTSPNKRAVGRQTGQGFDYAATEQSLLGDQRKPQIWQYLLAGVADFANRHWGNGQGASALDMLNQRQAGMQDRQQYAARTLADWRYKDFARQNEADLRASAPFTIGRDRLQYDPATGRTGMIYDGPEDFELYAQNLGLEPGTPDYYRAVEDHVLRSSGPSAFDRDVALDDHRTGNDERMEGLRFDNRKRMEGIRQGNRREITNLRGAQRSGGRSRGRAPDTSLRTFRTPQEAMASGLPSGTAFRTPDGRTKVIP